MMEGLAKFSLPKEEVSKGSAETGCWRSGSGTPMAHYPRNSQMS